MTTHGWEIGFPVSFKLILRLYHLCTIFSKYFQYDPDLEQSDDFILESVVLSTLVFAGIW